MVVHEVDPGLWRRHFSLCQELWKAGMPCDPNSEGHVEIASDQPAQLFPTAIPTTWDYLWRAVQSFAE